VLIVNALLMIALPIGVVLVQRRTRGAAWRLFALGAASFALSQAVHLPLLGAWQSATRSGALPSFGATADAVVLGLLAALCEEPARWLVLRFATKERGRDAALALGAGHGGLEAIMLGVLALVGALNVMALGHATVADLVGSGVSADAAETAIDQVRVALAMPWYDAIGGAVERAIAIPLHVADSVLVTASMRRRQPALFALAVIAHAAADTIAVGLVGLHQPGWLVEVELGALLLPFAGVVLAWSRRNEPRNAEVGGGVDSTL
jgi:uncharacterized membrane protein YhfC